MKRIKDNLGKLIGFLVIVGIIAAIIAAIVSVLAIFGGALIKICCSEKIAIYLVDSEK